MKIIFKIMMLYNNKGRLKHDCFRAFTFKSVNQSAS